MIEYQRIIVNKTLKTEWMLVPLTEAATDTCGGKAGALGALMRAGLPVPDGFVVPFAVYGAAVRDLDLAHVVTEAGGADAARRMLEHHPVNPDVIEALGRAISGLGEAPVAVRSSAANEDNGDASAAGQHESILAVQGRTEVVDAVRACWASLFSTRAAAYRTLAVGDKSRGDELAMAVLVHHHLDAEISGVMITPASPDGATVIEASWGLGPSIVGGAVTPDSYRVDAGGTVTTSVADKQTRLDRSGTRLVSRDVPVERRDRPTLDDTTATQLAVLGRKVATVRGGPQDIEWAIADGHTWVVQARPVTGTPPPVASSPHTHGTAATLTGTPGSHGAATGTARIVRGPRDFARVGAGEILICPFTDPAWTPLVRIAGGVITEVGGVLSHAAIVAREHGIPAVLGVPNAMGRLADDVVVTVDGSAGTVTHMDPWPLDTST